MDIRVNEAEHGLSLIEQSAERACSRIAPTWPLDQFIAVNPYWGFLDQPIESAAATLGTLSGTRLLMPRDFYRQQWEGGQLRREHLERAIQAAGASCSVDEALAKLTDEAAAPQQLPLLCDAIDAQRDLRHAVSWRDFVTHQISQHCAAYFDKDQAAWTPAKRDGLYATWLRRIRADHSARLLMGDKGFAQRVRRLPHDHRLLLGAATCAIRPPSQALEEYFTALLLSINGWASWCAYERWQARLNERDDDHIVELLAIRLAWEWLLHDACADASILSAWRAQWAEQATRERDLRSTSAPDWLFQNAMELAYQETLVAGFASPPQSNDDRRPAVQAIFCIDVRSEVFRRALEATSNSIQTLGFAGFFGMPIAYAPLGTPLRRPHLPGLLAPKLCVSEEATPVALTERVARRRQARLQWYARWRQFRTSASSTFAFVESLGLAHAATLLRRSLRDKRAANPLEAAALPESQRNGMRLVLRDMSSPSHELDLERRCDLAAGILGAMPLTKNFARIVLLAGHGSQSANNPHAAGLDCGACGGQTGEVNARALATLLNDRSVRQGLQARGIFIPPDTRFIAGLHNTTTDEVQLYDLGEDDSGHAGDLSQLRLWLARAGEQARAERAATLMDIRDSEGSAAGLKTALKNRANDWAQVRPEWGLANNAAFIVAPRTRSRHLDLAGRTFLHDYDWRQDPEFATLELIMTAPMVVTNWINLQYYASTVDNCRYGSGNKVLHNVVGGRLGVFEGNGGDLRIGLPLQSLHDGESWRHTPLRLSVFIEAPQRAIDAVIAKHQPVRQLIEHGWLHLFRIESADRSVHQRVAGRWVAVRG